MKRVIILFGFLFLISLGLGFVSSVDYPYTDPETGIVYDQDYIDGDTTYNYCREVTLSFCTLSVSNGCRAAEGYGDLCEDSEFVAKCWSQQAAAGQGCGGAVGYYSWYAKNICCLLDQPCQPQTCGDLNAECGSISDGCEDMLDCGTCGSGYNCVDNICEEVVQEPTGDVSWTNMNDAVITTADKGDSVKLVFNRESIAGEVNFTIKKKDDILWIIDRTVDVQSTESTYIIWQPSDGGEYYFEVNYNDEEYTSNDLEVSSSEDNTAPTIRIIKPEDQSKYRINNNVEFELFVTDPDDELEVVLDVDDGQYNLGDCRLTSCDKDVSYTEHGVREIVASAKEVNRAGIAYNYTTLFIYELGVNKMAIISEPERDEKVLGPGDVSFNANQSYIANCTSDKCPGCEEVDGLWCYNLDKSGIGTDYEIGLNWTFFNSNNVLIDSALTGNWSVNYSSVVEFDKWFFDIGKIIAKLRIGYAAL